MSSPSSDSPANKPKKSASVLIATGILLSRLAGLIREAVFAAFLPLGPAFDAFAASVRIPNVMQMLLGEGTLSASFIPVYAEALDTDEEEAGRIAGAVATLLALVAAIFVLLGVLFAPWIVSAIAPGFRGDERFDLSVSLLRITFPAAGVTVLGAWCLGVLNSHRSFFLSYVAPVLWNVAQISAVVIGVLAFGIGDFDGPISELDDPATNVEVLGEVARLASYGLFVGAFLQFGVQVPSVKKLAKNLTFKLDPKRQGVRDVISRFGGAVLGRGVVQISAVIDQFLASLLVAGATGALLKAQVVYILPISIFAISVAAAELPELSRMTSKDEIRQRAQTGFGRILFFVSFTALAYILLGDKIVGTLFQRGRFTPDDTLLVWFALATYAIGLPASAASRLTQNALWSQGDTKGPAQAAIFRLVVGVAVALATMWTFDRLGTTDIRDAIPTLFDDGTVKESLRFGAMGITLGSAVASWVEAFVLGRLARKAVPDINPFEPLSRLLLPLGAAAAVAIVMRFVTDDMWPPLAMVLAVGLSGVTYLAVCWIRKVPEINLVLLGPLKKLRR